MKKLKITFTALVVLVTVMGTVAVSAATRFTGDCSSVLHGPLDRFQSGCNNDNILCCYKPSGEIVKGTYTAP